jgi:hypothetical protein
MQVEDHCQHILERSSIRHIVNPTFRGGALIIPPVKPGWASAHAQVYEKAVRDEASRYAEMTEMAYRQVNEGDAEVSPAAWEHLMATVHQSCWNAILKTDNRRYRHTSEEV